MTEDKRNTEGWRRTLPLKVTFLIGQFAIGVALPIDAVLGVGRFTDISFAGFPRVILFPLSLLTISCLPYSTRKVVRPNTKRELASILVISLLGGFIAFYVWKVTMAVLIHTVPALIPVVIFGVMVGLLYLFSQLKRDERMVREREQWFSRSQITRHDLRHPRRILTDRHKLGYVVSLLFNLVVFLTSGAVFVSTLSNPSTASTIITIGSGTICYLFGNGLHELLRQQPRHDHDESVT